MIQVDVQPELQPEQWTCIVALLTGDTDELAGTKAGVSRSTVQRWKQEAVFVAALNAERAALWAAHVERARSLVGRALSVVEAALDSDDEQVRVSAAWRVLGAARDVWSVRPSGPVTVGAVEADRRRAALLDVTALF